MLIVLSTASYKFQHNLRSVVSLLSKEKEKLCQKLLSVQCSSIELSSGNVLWSLTIDRRDTSTNITSRSVQSIEEVGEMIGNACQPDDI